MLLDVQITEKEKQEFEEVLKLKKNKTCCIVGFAPSWNDAPFDRRDIDFWGINELYLYLGEHKIETPFHMWFEIHDIKNSPSKQKPVHQNFLKQCKIPLITQRHWEEYPMSMPYPKNYVKAMVNNEGFVTDHDGAGYTDHSNQISWMTALAIYMGYEEIQIFGVDMAQESEYAFQRPACQFFIGLGLGKGINMLIPSTCQLLKAGCDYGFESDNKGRFAVKKRIESNKGIINKLDTRNLQLEYFVKNADSLLDNQEREFEFNSGLLNSERQSSMQNIALHKEIMGFLNDIPDNLSEVQKKAQHLIKNCQSNIQVSEQVIKKLNEKQKKNEEALNTRRTEHYINTKRYNTEIELNTKDIRALKGQIMEEQFLLNRNLV